MQRFTPDTIVVAAEQQISCDVDNEAALLNLDTGVYYGLDPMGAYIWKLVQSPMTVGDLRARVAQDFAEDQNIIDTDLTEFLQEMASAGLITSRTPSAQ